MPNPFLPAPTLGRRRLLIASSALASSLALSGCFGSFAATRALLDWNDDFDSKWVEWLVFLGLTILPVYPLFVAADVLVLNSVEFWTGSNPVSSPGKGGVVTRYATADPRMLELRVHDGTRQTFSGYLERTESGGLRLLDDSMRPLSETHVESGGLVLCGPAGQPLARLSAAERAWMTREIARGRVVPGVLEVALGDRYRQIGRVRAEHASSVVL